MNKAGHGILLGTIATFNWSGWGSPRDFSVKMYSPQNVIAFWSTGTDNRGTKQNTVVSICTICSSIQEIYILLPQCAILLQIPGIKINRFHKYHYQVGLCNGHVVCFLWTRFTKYYFIEYSNFKYQCNFITLFHIWSIKLYIHVLRRDSIWDPIRLWLLRCGTVTYCRLIPTFRSNMSL
jgi:hypothetical protein